MTRSTLCFGRKDIRARIRSAAALVLCQNASDDRLKWSASLSFQPASARTNREAAGPGGSSGPNDLSCRWISRISSTVTGGGGGASCSVLRGHGTKAEAEVSPKPIDLRSLLDCCPPAEAASAMPVNLVCEGQSRNQSGLSAPGKDEDSSRMNEKFLLPQNCLLPIIHLVSLEFLLRSEGLAPSAALAASAGASGAGR